MRQKSIAQEKHQKKWRAPFLSMPGIFPAHILVPKVILNIFRRFGGLFFRKYNYWTDNGSEVLVCASMAGKYVFFSFDTNKKTTRMR